MHPCYSTKLHTKKTYHLYHKGCVIGQSTTFLFHFCQFGRKNRVILKNITLRDFFLNDNTIFWLEWQKSQRILAEWPITHFLWYKWNDFLCVDFNWKQAGKAVFFALGRPNPEQNNSSGDTIVSIALVNIKLCPIDMDLQYPAIKNI